MDILLNGDIEILEAIAYSWSSEIIRSPLTINLYIPAGKFSTKTCSILSTLFNLLAVANFVGSPTEHVNG